MNTFSSSDKNQHLSTPNYSNQKVEIYCNTQSTTIKYKRSEDTIIIPKIYWNTICTESGQNPKYISKESWETALKKIEAGTLENFTSLPNSIQQVFSGSKIHPEDLEAINTDLQNQILEEHQKWHTYYHGGDLSRIQTLLFLGQEKKDAYNKQFYISPNSVESSLYGPYTVKLLTPITDHDVDKTYGTMMLSGRFIISKISLNPNFIKSPSIYTRFYE